MSGIFIYSCRRVDLSLKLLLVLYKKTEQEIFSIPESLSNFSSLKVIANHK